MLKQRRQAAEQVADRLFAAETAIDEAFAKTAELAQAMPMARHSANLSALHGQGAFERAAAAMTALGEARRQIVETHKELGETQLQIGLGAFGGSVPKPPQASLDEARRLRAV